jgi:phage gp36-like protein
MANPYCTVSDLVARYDRRTIFQLSNDANVTQADTDNVQTLLDDAASDFESYIDERYSLGNVRSASPMPNRIKAFICNRAAFNLFSRRERMPKFLEALYKLDTDWITKVQMGKINLPGITRAAAPIVADSSRPDGSSAFDYNFGWVPSPFGPTGSGNQNTGCGPLEIPPNMD